MTPRARIALIVAGVAVAALGLAYVATEGALFSRGHHEWRVVVEPEGNGSWALYVPRIMASEPERAEALDAMLATLEVTEGKAGFALDHMRMRVDGEGRAVILARREFGGMSGDREAFTQWRVPDLTVMHEGGPAALVTWSVDFSGGGGHTCWANAELSARVEPAQSAQLGMSSAGPPGDAMRPWRVACA